MSYPKSIIPPPSPAAATPSPPPLQEVLVTLSLLHRFEKFRFNFQFVSRTGKRYIVHTAFRGGRGRVTCHSRLLLLLWGGRQRSVFDTLHFHAQ